MLLEACLSYTVPKETGAPNYHQSHFTKVIWKIAEIERTFCVYETKASNKNFQGITKREYCFLQIRNKGMVVTELRIRVLLCCAEKIFKIAFPRKNFCLIKMHTLWYICFIST